MAKKFYFETLSVGCPRNMVESSTYRRLLIENGYEETHDIDHANCVVFNTCGCLDSLQKKARDAAASVNVDDHENVVVAGCYPFVDKGNTLEKDGYQIVAPGDYNEFAQKLQLEEARADEGSQFNQDDFVSQPKFVSTPSQFYRKLIKLNEVTSIYSRKITRFFKAIMMSDIYTYVTTGAGCSGNCTFCGIKNAIGDPKSRSLGEIVINFEKALQTNNKNIWLVSDDIGSWGSDLNSNVSVLLEKLLSYKEDFNLVINYFEPEMFKKHENKLLPQFSDPRIEQVCIPIQTGSQKLLKRMGRHYRIDETIQIVKKIRRSNPDIIVKTQIIVGFPGESWLDFFKTLKAFVHFDGVGVNAYARLKYTAAYNLKPLNEPVVKLRTIIGKSWANIIYLKYLFEVFKLKRGYIEK